MLANVVTHSLQMLVNVWLNWSRTAAWFLPLLAEATAIKAE
jgi:hypothetical protein